IVWNYETGQKIMKRIVEQEVSKFQKAIKTKDGQVVIAYSELNLKNREDELTASISSYKNKVFKLNPMKTLESKALSFTWELGISKEYDSQFQDLIEDRKEKIVIALKSGKNFGLVQISKNGELINSKYTDHVVGETWARSSGYEGVQKDDWFDISLRSRVLLAEDPNSDGYIVCKRLAHDAMKVKNEDGKSYFPAQPTFFYVNTNTLEVETWDFLCISDYGRHSGYSASHHILNASSVKSLVWHPKAGKFILTEEFRNIDGETSTSNSFHLNIWMIKPLWDRNWKSGAHDQKNYVDSY
ncbi:MAG: hypothetical protein KDC84_08985, partial [Crocinitomicaceae bacterium]|nr:hypothetical protein [Crocinitomicaceae bacterium]